MNQFKTTSVNLNFEGYYQEKQIQNISTEDGIYVAYAGTLSTGKDGKEYCDLNRILYIGKGTGTDNVHVRVAQHVNNDHPTWAKQLKKGEHILYSVAACDTKLVSDVEAALIYKNKPELNINSKESYTGDTHLLTVICNGRAALLKESITVL